MTRRSRWIVWLVALVLILAACGDDKDEKAGASGGGGGGDSITIGIGSDPTTLDPQSADDGGERAVNDNIYETLMQKNADGDLEPLLAASDPENVEPNRWRFKLRDGVEFTNGEKFNADAVVASVARVLDPELNSEQVSFFSTIDKAEKVDDLTVDILTKGPDPVLPNRMYWMKMVPPEYSKDSKFPNAPVGTGPYKFVKWDKGQQIVLERNENYWGDKPPIKHVTIKPIEEPGTRVSSLQAGELDLITNLPPEQVKEVPAYKDVSGIEFPIVKLNSRDGITKNVKVRQALNYAVDKEALAKDLLGGYADPVNGQLAKEAVFGYNPDLEPYPYDPAKAKQLLQEAGVAGQSIDLYSTSGRWLKDKEITEAVANYWTEAGLTVNVVINEFTKYLDFLFENKATTIFVSNSNELLDSDRPLSAVFETGGRLSSYSNPKVDPMIDQARTEIDESKRADLYHQIWKELRDDAAILYLLNNHDIYGMAKGVDFTPRVDGKVLVKDITIQ